MSTQPTYSAISFPPPRFLNLSCTSEQVQKHTEETLESALEIQETTQKTTLATRVSLMNQTALYQCAALGFFAAALGSLTIHMFEHLNDPESIPTTSFVSAISIIAALVFGYGTLQSEKASARYSREAEKQNAKTKAICHAASYLNGSKKMAEDLLNPHAAKDLPILFETFYTHTRSLQEGHVPGDLKAAWIEMKLLLDQTEASNKQKKISTLVQKKILPLTEHYATFLKLKLDDMSPAPEIKEDSFCEILNV